MPAYYNEIDPYAAAWLRILISAGHIAPGDVDERDIRDVRPDDLKPYTQCHFFAGIGVWSYALRRAGWPDDRPVWTGSCPCQPFSQAGAGGGFDDERHLWPDFHWLIRERQPAVVFGEQVASKDADPWIDLVQADLEAMEYAFGAIPFPAAGVGAPNIRDRLYWMAHAEVGGWREKRAHPGGSTSGNSAKGVATGSMPGGTARRMADSNGSKPAKPSRQRDRSRATDSPGPPGGDSGCSALPDTRPAGPTNGFWGDADWLACRDGKFRPVEPGTFPLAHGAAARVGRLRAYGNAINAEAAIVFIQAALEFRPRALSL